MKKKLIHEWPHQGHLGFRLAWDTAEADGQWLIKGLSEWGKRALFDSPAWNALERAGDRLDAAARAALGLKTEF